MNRRRALAALAGVAVLPLLAACPGGTEPEDCDAGDLAEGDPDCDDVDRTSRRRRRTGAAAEPAAPGEVGRVAAPAAGPAGGGADDIHNRAPALG